jgi:hypothetical protein
LAKFGNWARNLKTLAKGGEIWHLLNMGNKDARNREKKKPKKETPKAPPPRRDVSRITYTPAEPPKQ